MSQLKIKISELRAGDAAGAWWGLLRSARMEKVGGLDALLKKKKKKIKISNC